RAHVRADLHLVARLDLSRRADLLNDLLTLGLDRLDLEGFHPLRFHDENGGDGRRREDDEADHEMLSLHGPWALQDGWETLTADARGSWALLRTRGNSSPDRCGANCVRSLPALAFPSPVQVGLRAHGPSHDLENPSLLHELRREEIVVVRREELGETDALERLAHDGIRLVGTEEVHELAQAGILARGNAHACPATGPKPAALRWMRSACSPFIL